MSAKVSTNHKQLSYTAISQRTVLAIALGIICGAVAPYVLAETSHDIFPRAAQQMLDVLRTENSSNAARCMIAPSFAGDIIIGTHDRLFKYGDKILEVAGQPVPSSPINGFANLLRRQPPSGFVKLKVLREGTTLIISAPCSDARPFATQVEDALASAARGDFGSCVIKFGAATEMHELNWVLSNALFQCRKRAGMLLKPETQALYNVDKQAIVECAVVPDVLERIRPAMMADAELLARSGAGELAAQLQHEFAAAQDGSLAAQLRSGFLVDDGSITPPASRTGEADSLFDFRGVRIGDMATPGAVEQALRDKDSSFIAGVKCDVGVRGAQVCNGITVIAGAPAEVNALIDASGRLIRIRMSFPSDYFELVARGAEEKYGKPTTSASESVQNRMGAAFLNTTLVWGDLNGNYIQLSKYGNTVDRGFIYFGTRQDTALLNRVNDDSRKRTGF